MATVVVGLPQRGKVYLTGPNRTPDTTSTSTKSIVGLQKWFADLDYSLTSGDSPGVARTRSQGEVKCILVRNSSGIALLPGRVCVWKTGLTGKEVDGYVSLDSGTAAGVVDEWLPSTGVADKDYFWLAVHGPSNVRKSLDGNALIKDDFVIAITAATSQATTAGRITSILSTSNQTFAASGAMNRLGYAISTSATTAANILTYLDLPW